jgi:Putative Flp pilus-assembly TadE/G-like
MRPTTRSTSAGGAASAPPAAKKAMSRAQRGQMLVIFVLSIFVLTGFIALVIDVSWYWSNSLRVQRAADAAALAGAVDLPGNPGTTSDHPLGTGIGDALAEASKNGYVAGSGVTISAQQDSVAVSGGNTNQMDVTISAPVNTFFMRIFGIQTIQASRNSKAVFTLPVPMGSPENYYGDFGPVRNQTFNGVLTSPGGLTTLSGPGSACANGASSCFRDTGGQVLTKPNGFWATMNSEGAENVNGDAFQPFYDTAPGTPAATCGSTAGLQACYDPTDYYNYGISMPPNTTGGHVYIFDPTFCETSIANGTGDRWFGYGSSNTITRTGLSSWYELFDTANTPYDNSDDTRLASSGALFEDQVGYDTTMASSGTLPSGTKECRQGDSAYRDGRDYHDSWYLLNPGPGLSGGPNGTVYRLHATTTLPPNTTSGTVNQKTANGEQTFAIFANDAQGIANSALLPTVYGLGAMQMFTPLTATSSATTVSTFYLAQIPRSDAGKTLELNLWDPGDTSPLAATLQVLIPTSATTYAATPFTYSAATGTSNSARAACDSNSNNSPTNNSVLTSTGGGAGEFNGCWLTIDAPIPAGYTADQDGWWQISYSMVDTKPGPDTSNDVTTWTAHILGNPVHLIVP